MRMTKMSKLLPVSSIVLFSSLAVADVRLQGAGATFPAPIYQRWVTEFQTQKPEVKIDYQSIGSGGGIKGITQKTVDFGASDAPMNKKELDAVGGADKIVQIPTVAGAVVVAYNLPDLQGDLKLDGPTVADIFLGKITKWNDPKIAALNDGATLPDMAITSAHRTDGSGTNYVFSSYLATQSDEFKEKVGAAKQVEWPGGQGGKGNEGVTQVIQQTQGALGYIELAYAIQNKVTFGNVKNASGKFITPSIDSVAAAAKFDTIPADLTFDVSGSSQPAAYPIVTATWLLVFQQQDKVSQDQGRSEAVVHFLLWALDKGGDDAKALDYAVLPDALKQAALKSIATITWNGTPIVNALYK